ncbi:MAG: tRNA (5-methylaminomethyl-2-thiouridine)(34)-methyltransferase MnmD [Bacteroidales bacterium]|nr:tRNA (5-methylaminomethyl-2-thiouridine)(34)-methyltransferase MnmD [Bacteroidales bacterium]
MNSELKTENRKLILSEDGSHTVFDANVKEHFHSTFGAINESKEIFIKYGFNEILNSEKINILEIGFGTGLNAFLTFLENANHNKNIFYTAIEPYPVDEEIFLNLNYPQVLNVPENQKEVFLKMHKSPSGEKINISENFILLKEKIKLENFETKMKYDLIYFDAFSPEVQPELWTENIFKKIFDRLNINGILTTYSAKGEVKRNLKSAGFTIESLPGPKGKREVTRARKINL